MWTHAVLVIAVLTLIKGEGGSVSDVTTVYNVGKLCNPRVQNLSDFNTGNSATQYGAVDCSQVVTGKVYSHTNALGLLVYDYKQYYSEQQSNPNKIAECGKETYISPNGSGILRSPNYPSLYPDNYKCSWTLTTLPGYQVAMNIVDMQIELVENCRYDNIEVYDGLLPDSSLLGRYCGGTEYLPLTFKSSGTSLFIQFKTDHSNIYRGFSANFSSVAVKVPTSSIDGIEQMIHISSDESRQLCLALILYVHYETTDNLIYVSAVNQLNNENLTQAIHGLKAGWNVKHLNFRFQTKIISPVKVKVMKATASMEVKVFNVSSCNPDGEEVIMLPPYTVSPSAFSQLRFDLPVYHTSIEALMNVTKIPDETKQCLNGGELTSAACACRPGFSGSQCQLGCGKNRFGQDCKGLCSFHEPKCKGLLLCTRFTGCNCAPGYSGRDCKTQCSAGWYGNDCSVRCGHCASGRQCDIYTGKCHSCELGYVPPYCQQEYVYYALKPEVSSTEYGMLTVSFNPVNITGYGTPKLYQLQYREKGQEWRTYTTKNIPANSATSLLLMTGNNIVTETIDGLKDGVRYEARVLLLVATFNTYDGDRIQVSETVTKCDIPEVYDYNVTAVRNTTSITFMWSYVNSSVHWCPVDTYEVSWKEGWQWFTDHTQGNFTLTGFLPGLEIKFRVRAKTSKGFAPYSETLRTSTLHNESSSVEELHVVSAQATSVEISWLPPINSDGRFLFYKVTYKCTVQPACFPGCINASEGELTVAESTTVTLSQLLPFAQYKISVTPNDGPESSIYVGTVEVVPTESPRRSIHSPVRTNTSVTVFWSETSVCSSFMLGYNYQLTKKSENLKVLASGFTKDTSVSFHNLTAKTEYVVKVYISTIAGWNSESFLLIETSTSATGPDPVCNLTVYKRGRNMLGLRWAEPQATYGNLKSFTVTHSLGQEETSHIIQPTPCTVWPNLYCHTITNLRSNRQYNISVSGRNRDVAEDSVSTSVIGFTKESTPTVPEDLKLINTSSTSVGLQWNHPNLTNGILRSFLINVEETEEFDQDNCCQVYPLVETPVNEEMKTYEVEVTGLHAASTYYVSVTAKTVGMGPSQSLVVHTRPPHLPLNTLPTHEILDNTFASMVDGLSWLPQDQQPEVNNTNLYMPLIKTHLLLYVPLESHPVKQGVQSGTNNERLNALLQHLIYKPFFVFAEYNQDTLTTESDWLQSPSLSTFTPGQRYQLVAAQVTEYCGTYNADIRYSTTFTYL